MIKKLLSVLTVLTIFPLFTTVATAHNFEVDGIYYAITNSTNPSTVKVSFKGDYYDQYSSEYSGSVVIPDSVTYRNVTYSVSSIGAGAFFDCSGLTSITIPNSVTSIHEKAFKDCTGLTSISMPNSINYIGDEAFYGCSGITGSLNLPKYLSSIGESAFYGCSGITGSIIIPFFVEYIPAYCFYNCTGLDGDLSFGKNCASIGNGAFARDDVGFTNIKSMHIYYEEQHVIPGDWDECCPFGQVTSPSPGIKYGLDPNIVIYVPESLLEKYRKLAEGDPFTDWRVNWWGYFSPDCFRPLMEEQVVEPIYGDMDGNSMVDVDDVNAMINLILNYEQYKDLYSGSADLDGNGLVDVDDVNIIINIILGLDSPVATYTVNGVSFKMVRVQGGTFTMGATFEQAGRGFSNEFPTHKVTLSSYNIGQTEVTQALWRAVMGSNPSYFNGTGDSNYGSNHSEDYGTNLQRPVEYVNWYYCQEFITKLNKLTGKTFRLPTEAEWEFAARGGNHSLSYMFSGSNTIGDVAWYFDNIPSQSRGTYGYGTQSVGTKRPNELGIYDMCGNVSEWCSDQYGSYSSDTQTNPTGPDYGSNHVIRGGCWATEEPYCRVSRRDYEDRWNKRFSIGFRLAQ